MKTKLIRYILVLFVVCLSFSINAQTHKYTFAVKTGWAMTSFVNYDKTKDWISKGKGNELAFIGIGYRDIYLNLSYKYFTGLQSDKEMVFEGYTFPVTATYRNVHLNLTASYEYELRRRLYIEPKFGWIQNVITSDIVDENHDEIEINRANGLIIGSNLTKYLKFHKYVYLGVTGNINYNIIDYSNVSDDLDGNTLSYGIGLNLKVTN